MALLSFHAFPPFLGAAMKREKLADGTLVAMGNGLVGSSLLWLAHSKTWPVPTAPKYGFLYALILLGARLRRRRGLDWKLIVAPENKTSSTMYIELSRIAAVPSLPGDIGSHRMSLRRRTSSRQAPRQLSLSNLNQRESQQSPSGSTRENTEQRPQAQSRPRVQRRSASDDSSDDEILVPMNLSAFTKALLNDEQPEPGAEYAILGEGPASPSAQPPPRLYTRRSALAASTSSIPSDRGDLRESAGQREIRRDTRADNQ
ncbi:hypothetical protein F66182_3503 [Fusarium sp. NRRL 66182]|nr:hypothetical protein F66182_3503 [Fusarium sp. NRRL 66182]